MNTADWSALADLPALYSTDGETGDLPAVKLFTPDAGATWILWEFDEEDGMAFGLCDLGLGFPEMGSVSIDEIAAVRGNLGLPVERELYTNTRFDGYKAGGYTMPDDWKETK